MSRVKSVVKTLAWSLSLIVVFLLFFHALAPEVAYKTLGIRFYVVSYTGSMEPTLQYNDMIFVRRDDFASIRDGDIISFWTTTRTGRKIVATHSVIEITQVGDVRMIRTQGDSLPEPDFAPVTVDGAQGTNKYIGKYIGKNALVGSLFAYASSLPGAIALSSGVVAVIVIWYLLDDKKGGSEPQKEK